jgi:uncharacterized protein (DUF3084 family)
MTKEQKIISKLYEAKKVELGTHKVELGLIQDIEKDLNTWFSASNSVKQALTQLRAKVIKDNQELKLVETAIDKVQKAASELGADAIFKATQDLRKKQIAISSGLLSASDAIFKAIEKLP